MKYTQLQGLLKASPAERTDYLTKLIDSQRNKTLKVYREYYDGNHWQLNEDGKSNTTTSGKKVWGKKRAGLKFQNDVFLRESTGNETKFSYGQLQVRNYIKRFIQIYQDYIVGGDEIEVIIEESEEDTEILKVFWKDIGKFFKQQVSRMVLNTVAISKLTYDEKYILEVEDALDIYPIYDGKRQVGTAEIYMIDKIAAKGYGITTKEDNVVYMRVYYKENEQYHYVTMVAGKIVNESGKPERLADELNYDPYTIVSNIDHPFSRFDDNSLEDSEISDWIDKNDTLNASATIEFLTNLHLSSPKISLDLQVAKELGISLNDPALQEAIRNYQYSPYAIDTLPVKVDAGNEIPASFYVGQENVRSGLFEDAGVPQFLVNGKIPSGMATETLELGMRMLTKKIEQKRDRIIKLVRESSVKMLQAQGKEYEITDIEVNMPPVTGLSVKDVIKELKEGTQAGILPSRYTQSEILKLLNRGEDVALVKEIEQGSLASTAKAIQDRRLLLESSIEAKRQVEERQRDKDENEEIKARISELS